MASCIYTIPVTSPSHIPRYHVPLLPAPRHPYLAVLPKQFDMLIHVDTTSAVQPLDIPYGADAAAWATAAEAEAEEELKPRATHGDMPELWPSGV